MQPKQTTKYSTDKESGLSFRRDVLERCVKHKGHMMEPKQNNWILTRRLQVGFLKGDAEKREQQAEDFEGLVASVELLSKEEFNKNKP